MNILCLYCGEWYRILRQLATHPYVGCCGHYLCRYQEWMWRQEKYETMVDSHFTRAAA